MNLMGYVNENQKTQDEHFQAQQQIQDNVLSLQMKQLALKQQVTEDKAIQLYDPQNPASMDNVIDFLGKAGDSKGAVSLIKQQQDFNIKKANELIKNLQLENTMFYHQIQDKKADNQNQRWQAETNIQQQQLKINNIRAQTQAARENRMEEDMRWKQQGKVDGYKIRVQQLSNPNKLQISQALTTVEQDSRLTDAPASMQSKIAQIAAGRAGKAIASRLTPDNDNWTPEDFDSEVDRQLELMFQNKEVEPYVKPAFSLDNPLGGFGAPSGGLKQQSAGGKVLDATKVVQQMSAVKTPDELKAMVAADPSLKAEAIKIARQKGWIK